MMKRILLIAVLLTTSIGLPNAYSNEAQKPDWVPDISGEVTFETKYIWRGQTLGDDPVIQPGASISDYGFTFSVWGNYDTGSLDRFTEWDYVFDYTFNIGEARELFGFSKGGEFLDPLGISLGYTYYTFPNLDGDAYDSHEFYVGLAYDILLQPFITYYYDFDSGEGSYLEFGIGHSFDLGSEIESNIGITAGYNGSQWGFDSSMSNLLFSGDMSIPLFEYFTISPNVNYSLALDDQYDSEFYGGVTVSVEY